MNGSLVNLNCVGMQCPAPILAISKAAKAARRPTMMEVRADDGDFEKDVRAWCRSTGATLESIESVAGTYVARISLLDAGASVAPKEPAPPPPPSVNGTPAPLERGAAPPPPRTAGEPGRIDLDCRGMLGSEVIAHLSRVSRGATRASHVVVRASDRAFRRDVDAWCNSNRADLFTFAETDGYYVATVGIHGAAPPPNVPGPVPLASATAPRDLLTPIPARQTSSTLGADDRGNTPVRPPPSASSPSASSPSASSPSAGAPVDLRGQGADLALLQLGQRVIENGRVEFVADDPMLERHLRAWAQVIGAEADVSTDGGQIRGVVRLDARPKAQAVPIAAPMETALGVPRKNKATLMVLHNDFEPLVAALLTANACVAQGMEVEMVFTFWGVNVLRAAVPRHLPDEKPVPFMKKMMKWMMPAGPEAQQMSKMNMGGMGVEMMKFFMRKDNIMGVRQLMQQAAENNVKFVVCTMSMGVMGIQKSDLYAWPNLEFGGVVSFTASARESAVSLVF